MKVEGAIYKSENRLGKADWCFFQGTAALVFHTKNLALPCGVSP